MRLIVHSSRALPLVLSAMALAVLAACGGGGGGGTNANTPSITLVPPTWAVSGAYTPVLKVQGDVNATVLSTALSLVHPSSPTTEYIIDTTATPTALGVQLDQGTYDSATQRYNNLTPIAYVDSSPTSVRTTALVANGQRPAQASAASTTLCPDNLSALNFTTAFSSQLAVKSPGTDGVCGTRDDTQSLVTFSAAGVPSVTRVTLGNMLGYFRSTSTGLPTQWLVAAPNGQLYTQPIGVGAVGTLNTAPVPSTTPTYQPLLNLNDMVLFTQDGLLRSATVQSGITSLNNVSALTGPEGWKSAGFDANNVYAYLNSSTATSGAGSWRILAISRTSRIATTLATGIGSLVAAEATTAQLYATVANGSTFATVKVATPSGVQSSYIAPTSSAASVVATTGTGVNLLVTATTATPPRVSAAVINAAGTVLFNAPDSVAYGGDQPFFDAVADTRPLTSVVFLSPSGGTGFGGSAITRFDTTSLTSRSLGTVPNGAALGGLASEAVFVSPLVANNGFGGTAMGRLSNNVLQSSGSAVYTYNTGIPNSLTRTTAQVR
jgi:hypothetical protein